MIIERPETWRPTWLWFLWNLPSIIEGFQALCDGYIYALEINPDGTRFVTKKEHDQESWDYWIASGVPEYIEELGTQFLDQVESDLADQTERLTRPQNN